VSSTAGDTCSSGRFTATWRGEGRARDRWGNLVYRKSARNYGPTMSSAAKVTIAQVTRPSSRRARPRGIVTRGSS